ncbi:MAG: LL-diaminopimelate aminotransferase [Deltaproteobacteria bacterium]|nr:LL-diaminopimelate aminotransferase [Deltaproteobacteria bacterium]
MITINPHYQKLQDSYLFATISKRVDAFQKANPDREIIKLGIGDVTLPLPSACIDAFRQGVDEMADEKTFQGYGPYEGYLFLREKIAESDFAKRGARISADEVFVSDGAKSDSANIQEIFSNDVIVAIPDPVYPVYLDTNVMAGRTGAFEAGRYQRVVYLDSTKANGFVPEPPSSAVDLIYLCYPNNPTGATISKSQLRSWVDYAHQNKALILYDAAYVAFIRDPSLPQSIYEIEGADEVAIEFRSFSKTAGFTGTRCAYSIIPKVCRAFDQSGNRRSPHQLWERRLSTKFNGVSYPVQKAAAAVYSETGQKQIRELGDYYLRNAGLIRREMTALGFDCVGGDNSPYIWVNAKMDSWKLFDLLLSEAGVVCTPGAGFGACGEGYIRLSAFNSYQNVEKAMVRIKSAL